MAPDLNSLPTSRPPSLPDSPSHQRPRPSSREMQQSNVSNTSSPRLRRMSNALATADPNHHRQPSLGELHQELESEQEAQVNRLLHMIRIQQDQLAAIQRQQHTPQDASSPTSIEHPSLPTPSSTASALSQVPSQSAEQSSPRSTSGSGAAHQSYGHFNRPHSLSRQSSARQSAGNNNGGHSRGTSPAPRPTSGSLGLVTEDFLLGGTRDESAFYQAETQTLTRENQMLKLRIRELERQIAEMSLTSSSQPGGSSAGGLPRSPVQNSPLASPPVTLAGEAAPSLPATTDVKRD